MKFTPEDVLITGIKGEIYPCKIDIFRATYSEGNGVGVTVFEQVAKERQSQDKKWGEQNHHPMEWLAILGEEVGEANKAALEAHFAGYDRTGNLDNYREELIQGAAVAVAMVECLDRDKWNAVRRND